MIRSSLATVKYQFRPTGAFESAVFSRFRTGYAHSFPRTDDLPYRGRTRHHQFTVTLVKWSLICKQFFWELGFDQMKPVKMLLVEDSPADVRLVREALKETGVPVDMVVARDGVEATDYLHQAESGRAVRPELILLDLNLPKKNGREVLVDIKNSPDLKQIPVLVMTSSKAEDDINEAYMLNANCYITKPADLTEYLEVIRAIEEFWFFTAKLPQPFREIPSRAERASARWQMPLSAA